MAKKIFIDGKAGTTGLRIFERLENFEGIEIITLSDEKRKDINARKEAGKKFSIVVVAEGAFPKGGGITVKDVSPQATIHINNIAKNKKYLLMLFILATID